MALTNNGTAVYLELVQLPAGYTPPTITKFSDHEYKYEGAILTIAKSGIQNASKVTTFTALVAAVTAAASAMVTADFNVSGLTVTAYSNLRIVYHNFDMAGVLYTDGAINYLCTVDIFVKTAAL
jgi:hypothetical protein